MATAVQPRLAHSPPEKPRLTVGDELIAQRIAEAQSALWRAELSRALLIGVIGGLSALVGWFVIDQWVWSPGRIGRVAALVTGLVFAGWWLLTRVLPLAGRRIRADYAAQSLELDMPELRHALTSYVALRDDVERPGVRGAVVRSIGVRAAGQIKQHRLEIPSEATGILGWWIAVAVVLAAFAAYSLLSPKNTLQSAQRLFLPLAKIDPPTRVTIRDVLPGDTEMLADREVEISAVIDQVAAQDEPVIRFGYGFGQSEPLQWDDSSGRHSAVVKISHSTRYRIEAGDAIAGPFKIVARDVPVATVRSITITPPKYTGLPARGLTGGAVSAEENSQVLVTVSTNRPIARGRIDFNPRTLGDDSARSNGRRSGATAGSVEMTVDEDGMSLSGGFAVKLPRDGKAAVAIDSYAIRVWDAEDNSNPDPIVYPVRIIPDLAPEVRFGLPREPVQDVPINGQQRLEVSGLDPDYGLRKIELSLRRGADPVVVETLWSSAVGVRGNQYAEYRFRPAELGYRVGDKILVTARASDNREDVAGQPQPNRTETQPIELRIVAEQPLPPPTADADGLSEPDDQPAAEQSGEAPSTEDDGEGDSGQNGATGGQPSESESAEEGDRGDGESQPSDQSDPTTGDEAKTGDGDGDGKSGSEGSEGGAAGDRENGTDEDASEGPEEMSREDVGREEMGRAGSGRDGEEVDSETASADDSAGELGDRPDNGSDPAAPSQPPQHDGDAFERIRDYLEQNRSQGESATDDSASDPEGDAVESEAAEPGVDGADSERENGDQVADGDESAEADRETGEGQAADGDREPDGGPEQPSRESEPAGSDPTASESAETDSSEGDSSEAAETDSSEADSSEADSSESEPADSDPLEADPMPDEPTPRDQAGERQPSSAEEASEANGEPDGGGEDTGGPPADGEAPSAGEPATEGAGDAASADQSSRDGGPPAEAGDGQAAEGVGDAGSDEVRPPDPVDLDYARQATDLVLDYLDQNRDTPDPELLDRLNWTPEELRDFTQRWRQTLQPTDDGGSVDPRQVEDALKSLGIRKPTDRTIGETRDSADELRGLQDGGNRPPAPSLYRDAFEAFRRGVGR